MSGATSQSISPQTDPHAPAETATERGRCAGSDPGAMPVPAGNLSDSPAAAFASSPSLIPPPPINSRQPGIVTSLLYSGSKFRGHQKSKGNSYDVEVVLQVRWRNGCAVITVSCQRRSTCQ